MKLHESPSERLKTVTLGLFSDQSGPNVVLGVFITAALQAATGRAPWWWAAASGAVWALSVAVYALVDEVRQAIEERKNRVLDEESEYYGIE